MSWSLSVPATPKAGFDAAVDAAKASGQEGVATRDDDIGVAKTCLKAIAARLDPAKKIGGGASGHVPTGADYNKRSIQANAYESD